MNELPTRCPCCDAELPLGLFSREARVVLPHALLEMNKAGIAVDISDGGETYLHAAGRYFISAWATLPLDWDESPVKVGVWVEVDHLAYRRVRETATGERSEFAGSGTLATDVPAFAGSLGARVAFRFEDGDERPRVYRCADSRLASMHGHGGHDGLVDLYRRCWGEVPAHVAPAHLALRSRVHDTWMSLLGRPTYRLAIEPPPVLAGIHPAELVIAPPLDTGGVAAAATLGIAEANPADAVELATFAADPGDDFIRSFSEFCYWSRRTSTPLSAGSLINERNSIPQTSGMNNWLLCDPWWLEDWDEPQVAFDKVNVRLLAAVAVHELEADLARRRGSEALVDALKRSEADLTDLAREPVFL